MSSHSLVLEAIIALLIYNYTTCMYMYLYYLHSNIVWWFVVMQ